jgi:thiamine pyrophosphokinase
VIKPGNTKVFKDNYRYISFFSYTEQVENLNLTGFKFELKNYTLKNVSSLCLSNEIAEQEAIIQFDKGLLLIVESND